FERVARQLEDATSVFSELRQPSKQPWRGIGTIAVSAFDTEEIANEALQIAAAIRTLQDSADNLKAVLHSDGDFSTPGDVGKRLFEGIECAPDEIDDDLAGSIGGMLSREARDDALSLAIALDDVQKSLAFFEELEHPTIRQTSPEQLRNIVVKSI